VLLLDKISMAQDATIRATRPSPLFEEVENEEPLHAPLCNMALGGHLARWSSDGIARRCYGA